VLLFQQSGGLTQSDVEAGIEMNVDFFLGILNALNVGDMLNEASYAVRPYEIESGSTDRCMQSATDSLHQVFRDRMSRNRSGGPTGKFIGQLRDDTYVRALRDAAEALDGVEIDRLRVKPIVKITGEFWAQTTEGDGNFKMFQFLQEEGAQVLVEPIATWIAYMMYVAKEGAIARADAEAPYRDPKWYEVKKRMANKLKVVKKTGGLSAGSVMWNHFYHRTIRHMGDTAHRLIPQKELSRLAHPFYHQLARGGEGYMEVGKNVYYTVNHLCHMVLALKPFGCMPSTQSDGVQSRVVNKFKDMIFLPIETSGEGEVNAHSRVQMALAEAKAKAKAEFEGVLNQTGKTLDELRDYVAEHPELKHALYKFPHRHGVAGTAAQFAWHVSDLINKDAKYRRRVRVPAASAQVA
jgi:predicted nucleotide-binding protein (sugar kinase/HSP70/actin superfamily)